jgi:hypothetical protein
MFTSSAVGSSRLDRQPPYTQSAPRRLKAVAEASIRFAALPNSSIVLAHQPQIPRDIGGEDRGETAGLAHVPSPVAKRRPDK